MRGLAPTPPAGNAAGLQQTDSAGHLKFLESRPYLLITSPSGTRHFLRHFPYLLIDCIEDWLLRTPTAELAIRCPVTNPKDALLTAEIAKDAENAHLCVSSRCPRFKSFPVIDP